MSLTSVQQQIIDTPGNLIVRASAGTGKTHTMVAKIAAEIDRNHSHKAIAAITFTIKAAQEIKDRLPIDISRHFIGTTTLIISKKPGNTGISRDIRTEFTTDLLLSD